MNDCTELYQEFVVDSLELVDGAEDAFLRLENGETIGTHYDLIFRAFHNIKGSSGMLGLGELQEVVHELETRFLNIKDIQQLEAKDCVYFLSGVDVVRSMLKALIGEVDPSYVQQALEKMNTVDEVEASFSCRFQRESACAADKQPESALSPYQNPNYENYQKKVEAQMALLEGANNPDVLMTIKEEFLFVLEETKNAAEKAEFQAGILKSEKMIELVNKSNDSTFGQKQFDCIAKLTKTMLEPGPMAAEKIEIAQVMGSGLDFTLKEEVMPEVKTEIKTEVKTEVKIETLGEQAPEPMAETKVEAKTDSKENGHVKVPVSHLDKLMNLMGEMVLVRNQVLQYSKRQEEYEFLNLSQRLDVVTTELQEQVMKTRMQPIGNILTRYNRIVRDLSNQLNKKIKLELKGVDTELDKSLLELVKDPLTHIIRNSCDHGLETPEERLAAGKPEQGTVIVNAFHEGGQVVINISDDGKGLNPQALIAKAIQKNILTEAEAAGLALDEVYNLIFHPGFSTAGEVTNISGRGVGMDVVKSNLEKMGGGIKLSSELGKGMTIQLNVPLTLAIVPALTVNSGGSRYVIPQIRLVELVRVERGDEKLQIELIQERPVLTLRGQILPLVNLREALDLETREQFVKDLNEREDFCVVVLKSGGDKYGLIVDGVEDTADIVVKPLNPILSNLFLYSGVTVLGNGDIALILDVEGIAANFNLKLEQQEEVSAEEEAKFFEGEKIDLLQFDQGCASKMALPLKMVDRLEEFSPKLIERSGNEFVVKYTDCLLRLVDLSNSLSSLVSQGSSEDPLQVIVVNRGSLKFGLVVKNILDVHSVNALDMESAPENRAHFGRVAIGESILTVIDVDHIIGMKGYVIEAEKFKVINDQEKAA